MDKIHLFVSGTVQGVGFRYATYREANRLGLTGWVRNTEDGRVEVLAEGTTEALSTLEKWCGHGPSGAKVTGVQIVSRGSIAQAKFGAFEIDR